MARLSSDENTVAAIYTRKSNILDDLKGFVIFCLYLKFDPWPFTLESEANYGQ